MRVCIYCEILFRDAQAGFAAENAKTQKPRKPCKTLKLKRSQQPINPIYPICPTPSLLSIHPAYPPIMTVIYTYISMYQIGHILSCLSQINSMFSRLFSLICVTIYVIFHVCFTHRILSHLIVSSHMLTCLIRSCPVSPCHILSYPLSSYLTHLIFTFVIMSYHTQPYRILSSIPLFHLCVHVSVYLSTNLLTCGTIDPIYLSICRLVCMVYLVWLVCSIYHIYHIYLIYTTYFLLSSGTFACLILSYLTLFVQSCLIALYLTPCYPILSCYPHLIILYLILSGRICLSTYLPILLTPFFPPFLSISLYSLIVFSILCI